MDRNRAVWLPLVLAASLGTSESAAQATLLANEGLAAGDAFGACVLRIADVNGDLVPDLLVGAPNSSPSGATNAGEIAVVSGANGVRLTTIPGSVALERFGSSLASLGDVTGDGVPEVSVGVPGAGGGLQTGAVRKIGRAHV